MGNLNWVTCACYNVQLSVWDFCDPVLCVSSNMLVCLPIHFFPFLITAVFPQWSVSILSERKTTACRSTRWNGVCVIWLTHQRNPSCKKGSTQTPTLTHTAAGWNRWFPSDKMSPCLWDSNRRPISLKNADVVQVDLQHLGHGGSRSYVKAALFLQYLMLELKELDNQGKPDRSSLCLNYSCHCL